MVNKVRNKAIANIKSRLSKLSFDIGKCDERLPTIGADIMDSINLYVRDNEITKDEGDNLKKELRMGLRVFERHCFCESTQEREYQERHKK